MRSALPPLCLVLLLVPARAAADPAEDGVAFFETKVRPVLVENCYPCHSVAAGKQRGGLYLDTREAVRKGGDNGPAVVPGKPQDSLLVKAVRQRPGGPKMPPKGKLPDGVVADLEEWVKRGAPDPRDRADATTISWEDALRVRRQWWSLQPVRQPAVPLVQDGTWSAHPVDRFVLGRLEERGLSPAGPADRRTLLRRLSLVLTGLPPDPAAVEAFAADEAPDAYEKVVDGLLASPHFGERWARHWNDVVRFTETHGNEWNYEVHHAWRYRDYLIRAFNDDVPFDQLVREHLAGDLLPHPRRDPAEGFNESVIGTAFYRFGEANHDDCISLPQIGFDLADNQLDTLTKAFQATTVACARCHDHKLDAVSMKDYYGLLGILRSSRLVSHTIDAPGTNAAPMKRIRELKADVRKELGDVWLGEARQVGRYLRAADARRAGRADAAELARGLDPKRLESWEAALKVEKAPPEDLLQPWRMLAAADATAFPAEWRKQAEAFAKEDRERAEANTRNFVNFADFRGGDFAGWQAGGQGLRDGPSRSGDFALGPDGDTLLRGVLPAGCYTFTLSDRLNGTLRSPVLPRGAKHLSFQVLGQRSSAVRLVSNNCQLNYKNYRALTGSELQWVTFAPPEDADGLRVYAELMTMFDNPKFPDQLSALGGDKDNYRVPWDKAAADPRSFFGVTRVVAHDGPEPPKPELGHLRPLFAGPEPAELADLANRYAAAVEAAVRAWAADRATDDDVRWLDGLLRRGLLGNDVRLTPRLEALAGRYREVEKGLALPRIVPGVADCGPGFEQPVLTRGDCTRPGEAVPRHYLEALRQPGETFRPAGSGRLELAERIASPDNPLTARVMVNRVWHHLFGTGLVRTPDDFGHGGELPSHPELLDYLAAQFVEDGWSVKRLVRTLVLTRTFRQESTPSPRAKEIDPQDRLLQHYPARRLEAEAIRDSILAASGRLDGRLFGPSVQPFREKENTDRRLFPGPLDGGGRRSVYVKNNLMESPAFLGAFNLPGGKVAQGRRDVTDTPAQALALLNDPFVLQQAGVWADRLVTRPDPSVGARVDHLFLVGLGRPPAKEERERFEQAVARLAELHGVPAGEVLRSREVWQDVAHALFNLSEFIYVP
jgi:hypothetical protein